MANRNVVTVKVNLNGVDKKLLEVGPKLARKSMRKALRAVGTKWVEEVKSRVPVLEGDLKNSIVAKVSTGKDGTNGRVAVGPNLRFKRTDGKKSVGPGVYAMWVEFGLKKKKYPAHPFMRPCFDSTKEKVVELFADTLREGLEEIVKG